jgi:hypothetical protein
VISAAALAWGLAVFAVWVFGWMPQVGEATPWDWVWTGAGAIILLETLVRLLSPDFERPSGGRTLLGGSLVLSGLHSFTGLTIPLWLVGLVFGTWLVVDRARQQQRWGQDASAQSDARQDADPRSLDSTKGVR